ncbi:MAG TPA: hypothetical protein VLX85_02350 [Stellaceae bacterium]|nr:hypothetical protein [Stellaceae bacterium]
MTINLSSPRRPLGAIALAILLGAAVASCAQAPAATLDNATPGSGSSAPGQINFHGFPYDIQAGS